MVLRQQAFSTILAQFVERPGADVLQVVGVARHRVCLLHLVEPLHEDDLDPACPLASL
jgi:hypothetical protein